jgi:hypothetical protein
LRIPLIEERDNRRVLFRRDGFHGDSEQSRRRMNQVQHAKLMQIRSHDIVYTHMTNPCLVLVFNIENQRNYLRVKKLPK